MASVPNCEYASKNDIKPRFRAVKSQNLQETMQNMSTYASGLGRFLRWTVSGWVELRVLRPVLASETKVEEGTGCDELAVAASCQTQSGNVSVPSMNGAMVCK